MSNLVKEFDTSLALLLSSGAKAATSFQKSVVHMQAAAQATKLRISAATRQHKRALLHATTSADKHKGGNRRG